MKAWVFYQDALIQDALNHSHEQTVDMNALLHDKNIAWKITTTLVWEFVLELYTSMTYFI